MSEDLSYKKPVILEAKGLQKCTIFLNRKEHESINIKGQGNENCFWSICCMSMALIGNSLTSSPKASSESGLSDSIIVMLQTRNVKPTAVTVSFT